MTTNKADWSISYEYIVLAILIVIIMATIFFYLLPAFLSERARRKQCATSNENKSYVDFLSSKGCFRIEHQQLGTFLDRMKRIVTKYKDHLAFMIPDERQKNEAASVDELEREIKVATVINHLKKALADFNCENCIELDKAAAVAALTPQKIEMDHYDSSCVDLSMSRVARMLIEITTAIEQMHTFMLGTTAAQRRYFVDVRHLDAAIIELDNIFQSR